jgi:hypothetical protein
MFVLQDFRPSNHIYQKLAIVQQISLIPNEPYEPRAVVVRRFTIAAQMSASVLHPRAGVKHKNDFVGVQVCT